MSETTETKAPEATPAPLQPLRIWPAAILLLAMAGFTLATSLAGPDQQQVMFIGIMGRLLAGILLALWWVSFSRATGKEKLHGFAGLFIIVGFTLLLIHPSMRGPGMFLITVPLGMAAFGVAAVLCGRMHTTTRTYLVLAVTALAFAASLFLRNEGMWSDAALAIQWRWSPTAEEQRLDEGVFGDRKAEAQPLDASAAANLADPVWPEFRGPGRTSRQHGTRLATDWEANPPVEQWRIPVGPAWSSFAVAGDLLFTQEQHGEREAVTCYNAKTGELHWITEVESRFSDPLGGPGPRATPTLHEGALYVMGAEGLLLRLDALTGEITWQTDIREIADRTPPAWGFASSPLVSNGVVIVHAGGKGDKGVLAFALDTGDLQWSAPAGDHTYSSPQQGDLAGTPAVLILTNTGLTVLAPDSGDVRFDYAWKHSGYRALQPQLHGDGTLFLPSGIGTGTRLIKLDATGEALAAEEVWTSLDLRPDFNDCVFYQDHAYGFDGGRFACVDLNTGERKWRGGRYGKGQVLLLEDAGQLLVTSEKGDVVLLEATSEAHRELASFKAFEGKTWNHPVLIGDRLYIRNAEEAACYKMPMG